MNLAAIGALLTGIAGIITAVISFRKAKQESAHDCHERLRAMQEEAESLAQELHRYRMDRDDGRASLWLLAAVAFFILAAILAAYAHPIHGPVGPPGPGGPPGPTGGPGPPGRSGEPGPTATTIIVTPGTGTGTGTPGATGSVGTPGATGSEGTPGVGSTGPQGVPGPAGPPGPAGEPGSQGLQGVRGPAGLQCPPGTTFEPVEVKADKGGTITIWACIP